MKPSRMLPLLGGAGHGLVCPCGMFSALLCFPVVGRLASITPLRQFVVPLRDLITAVRQLTKTRHLPGSNRYGRGRPGRLGRRPEGAEGGPFRSVLAVSAHRLGLTLCLWPWLMASLFPLVEFLVDFLPPARRMATNPRPLLFILLNGVMDATANTRTACRSGCCYLQVLR